MGNAEKAVGLFMEAKDILTACNMQNDYSYASVLNNLALAYQDLGEFDKALAAASQALELMKQEADNEHEIATSLNNLSAIYFKKDETDKAEETIDKALSLYNGMIQPNVHHAAALSMKAMLLGRKEKPAEAIVYFNKSLEKTKHFFGQNIEYAVTEQNIAMTYKALGEFASAVGHMESALYLFEKILGPEHERTKMCRSMLQSIQSEETPE